MSIFVNRFKVLADHAMHKTTRNYEILHAVD